MRTDVLSPGRCVGGDSWRMAMASTASDVLPLEDGLPTDLDSAALPQILSTTMAIRIVRTKNQDVFDVFR